MNARSKPVVNLFTLFALLISLIGSAVYVTPAHAASIVVNSSADTVADDGFCTLREAITAANTDTASGATSGECSAGSGADAISFAANYTITLVGSQLPPVTSQMTINGNGAANTIVQANAVPNTATYRVFQVGGSANLTLDGMTVRHGRCDGSCAASPSVGGGIYHNGGTLTVTNSTISGNSATSFGGGIYIFGGTVNFTNSTISGNSASSVGGGIYHNGGTLTVTNSTISGNSATSFGGGIYNAGGTVNFTNSTISGNSASAAGGGIYNNGGVLTVTNSTISNNSASAGGGGIFNLGTATITNSTISGNSATADGGGGGGIFNLGTATITNSTFSGNGASSSGGGGINNFGFLDFANNIIANSISGGDCILAAAANTNVANLIEDQSCNYAYSGDPNLGSLQNNGGPTQTHALLAGSIAIDAGAPTTCSNSPVSNKDQRGVTRPIDGDAVAGAVCDIGAFEYGAIIPVVTASNPSANAVLTSLSSITVVFNQDMLDNATADGAENINNYILVERGTNGSFDTTSCVGGVVSDDVQQTINTASYNSAGFITSLILAGPLADGVYRLFVCGTTSVWSAAGLELNNGANDTTVDFTINGTGTTGNTNGTTPTSTDASSLPATGFAPNKVTSLPEQPATLKYAELGDLWLEIPSLNIKSSIVGVPQNEDNTWDVSWLGNSTGWLNGTAFPTWTGNSVLTAHVTNADGLDGPFATLKSLRYGDQVIVHLGGAQYVYEVRETRIAMPYSTSYAFRSFEDYSYLTLVTCQGYNPLNDSYVFRRLVRAVLVEVK